MERVLKAIYGQVRSGKDYHSYVDLKDFCREVMKTDIPLAIKYLSLLSDRIEQVMPTLPFEEMGSFFELHHDVVLLGAPHSFHLYLLAVEWNRDPERKFYPPRRRVLKTLVDDLQDLADHKLDFLGISLPPRVGKSTLCIFFMTWMMGRNPDVANVMSGHSDKLTDGFYRELLSIIKDTTQYDWAVVFPNVPIADTSAKNETIDLNHTKRFPTMTCRSIGGTLTGAVEIGSGGVLYCDDLIEDLEESLNPARLEAKYNAYLNQLKDRKKLGALELMVGTRWNVFDPLGRIQDQYEGNERYRFRVIPALNEDDESNFNYEYGVGFDTAYYRDMRESIDDATWNAKYQGAPYIREGLLFPEDELLTYNGVLPDGDPEKVVVCDVAWGGGDSLSIGYSSKEVTHMIYIKVLKDDTVVAVEAHPSPVYVYKQANGVLVRCTERKAQGILSIDGGTVYQLHEKEALENATMTAMVITTTEYLSLVDTLDKEDTEDTDPVVPEDTTEEEVLTRAQLTAKVTALETELAAAKILLGVE